MGTGRRLLLADDSITIQKVVNLTFADEGLEVVTVGNGDLAVEKIEDLAPDIVLADIHMPGLNGYEVCEFVKRNARFRHIPVMLLVGSFEPFNEAEARRVGADDYLTKPFQSIRQLVSKVGALLGGKSAAEDDSPTSDLTSPVEAHSEAAPPPPAPTAPLAESNWSGFEDANIGRNPGGSDAFTDPGLDDAMIEATPAAELNLHRTAISQQRPTMPLTAADLEEAGINLNQTSPGQNLNQTSPINMQETLRMPQTIEESDESAEDSARQTEAADELAAAPPAPAATRFSEAAAADDTLLDLGEMETPRAAAEADDFILDIWEEAPAAHASAAHASAAPAADASEASSPVLEDDTAMAPPVAATDYVEAEVIEAEPVWEVAPLEEAEAEDEQPTVTAVSPAETSGQVLKSEHAAIINPLPQEQSQTGQITLDQLSPEAIDAIARRAVEQLSERVVQEIAWEVVPQLAELLIKRRLEEEQKK